MESNVRTLASNLGRFFRPSEAYFVPMKHPRVALRAPLVRFMGTKNASSVRKNRLVYGLGTKLPICCSIRDRLHDQPCHFFPVATYELYGGCTGDLRAVSPTFNSSAIQLQRQEALCVVSTPADVDVKDSCIAVEIPWLVWLPAIGIFEQSRIDIHVVAAGFEYEESG